MFGRTTNSWLNNLRWARKAIFSFSYWPLEFITGLAIFTVIAAAIAAVAVVVVRIIDPSSVQNGLTTVIVVVLFFGGIQLLCLSIIGSYLEHIYDEVKRRPPYVVESILNAPAKNPEP
jgi:dolichol-phosphate mannosyltransferase